MSSTEMSSNDLSAKSPTNSVSFHDEHEAFAASRVSQYVFVPTKEVYFNTLEQHADTLEGDVKPPLVLVGNEGSGKSALLANWVAKRREHKHRDEFLFQHYVGCTTQSLQLSHTLFRLETALKDFFQLREMKVPDTEVELRWSLNRFLEAASKKHSPARIVIIIDGIHRLKAEGATEGVLYWLPTDLPPCVRFIVSTVEFERSFRGKKESVSHRTFVELFRRQCPMLRIEPLGVGTRHNIISAFSKMHTGALEITEPQQFKIVTAQSSAQPMYLRTLLQGIKLAATITKANLDEILDQFLACTTAHELIDKCLNICCRLGDGNDNSSTSQMIDGDESILSILLEKIMAMIYVSRSGLTEAEIWGLMRMIGKTGTEEQHHTLMTIVKDFTMVVDDMYSFSHEIYREVFYQKYIMSKQTLNKWHNVLARFFGQLPPVARKLVALPYHLEMAGNWSKVKNCLTDIEMFRLWWTPKFKSDFIKFWASLTSLEKPENETANASNTKTKTRKSHTSESSDYDEKANGNRPTYDIVEEYVKSLDEYRNAKEPSDEEVAGIILEIGDFLLEFATLGHETDADVPTLVHPKVLPEDLSAIGVPFIEIDEEGRSSLVYPQILHSLCNKQKTDDGPMLDAPTKAIDDVPLCTTYYYSRWMWIQYPYVALGNCSARFNEGVNQRVQEMADTQAKKQGETSAELRNSASAGGLRKNKLAAIGNRSVGSNGDDSMMSKSWSVDSFKLPKIKFNRKAAKSFPRVTKHTNPDEEGNSKVAQRIEALQDNIQNYREECDFLVQFKGILDRRLQELKDALIDLKRTAQSVTEVDGALSEAVKRESEAENKYESVRTLNINLKSLAVMCDRHPANVPALITELQDKIEQDKFLLSEIKKRLWEQRFERQAHNTNFRSVKNLLQEAVQMFGKLADYRQSYASGLLTQVKEDERALQSGSRNKRVRERTKDNSISASTDKLDQNKDLEPVQQKQSWEEIWSIISSRTGITEPEAFFQRMNNSSALENQIKTIKKASESRLDQLKKDMVSVESELEEVRYEASFAGVQSSKEHKKQLAEKQQNLRQIKEKTETMELLEQRVIAGLAHISDILFIPKSEEDAPPSNLVRDIEAVLDTLINEREKQLQQQQGGSATAGNTTGQGVRDSTSAMGETHTNRSPELDFAIAKHESPKVRLPKMLPSKPIEVIEPEVVQTAADEDEQEDDGSWDRNYVKTKSMQSLRLEVRKSTNKLKLEKAMNTTL